MFIPFVGIAIIHLAGSTLTMTQFRLDKSTRREIKVAYVAGGL